LKLHVTMRHPALVAFAVTTATLVPAGLFGLDAGPAQRAKLFANKARSLVVDDAHIDVALDRNFADAGGTVHVKLSADKPAKVAVVVVGSTGSENQRVENPPRAIAHEVVELTADEYGKISADVPVKLAGAALEGAGGALAHYQFFVMAPEDADKLENWRRARTDRQRNRAVAPASSELAKLTTNIESNWTPGYSPVKYRPKTIASLDAYTRRRYRGFTIKAPDRARVDETFVAAVEIKNPTKQPATVTIAMKMPLIDEHMFGSDSVTIEGPDDAIQLAAGETRKVEFKVTASVKGTLALEATIDCGGCKLPYEAPAFEAVDIVESKKTVARR
jgi:hypothetical protein